MKKSLVSLVLFGIAAATANATIIISPDGSLYTSVTGSPGVNPNFTVDKLFDQTIAIGGDPGSGADEGRSWAAANGTAPNGPRLEFELDKSYTITNLVYAQRQFNTNQNRDKNTTARIWASTTTPFTSLNTPAGPADATVSLNFTTASDIFTDYKLATPIDGRYFYIEFDEAPNSGNNDVTGGAELRLAVPEPSSTALLGLGGLALLIRRRR
ncbi:hypothetical protein NT6N_22190 [Oceaniferula spumae]|uniref:Ice-binding protein C-terminal domain-containing protein n=1 Tax=Oceaniferula spumae TaxID=2979115 RepID=A0AAT9FME8_9BACT